MNSTTPPPDTADTSRGEFPPNAEVPAASGRGLERLTLPRPRTLLAGIVAVRLILVALSIGREIGPESTTRDAAFASFVCLAIGAVLATIWLAWVLRKSVALPGSNALLFQAIVDVLVVTSLISFPHPADTVATSVAALYIALVTAYALLLPVRGGLFVMAFAVSCYIGVTLISPQVVVDMLFWTQVGVIAFVGGLIAVLGNRLSGASREQRALAEALAQVRLEADEILATIQSGVISVDGHGRLGYLNPRGRRILGGDAGAFQTGQPVLETLRARSRALHDAIVRGITDGTRVARGEAAVRRTDGTLFPVGLSTTTFNRPGTDRRLVTAIFTDISDLKRLQEFRLRAERLEAVAALSASLAHEIRNPLAAIRSAVEQLARSAAADEDAQTLAQLVMRESERLNRLLTEFLDFSRVRAGNFERLDLMAVVRDAARVTGAHPAAAGTKIVIQGEAIDMDADQDLIHRVVSNLMLNAAQALDGRGTITVTVGRADVGEAPNGTIERPVKLLVRDDGPGIPDGVRERLFEPFVTGRQGGTGLGLAIVQRAVLAHRGVILVDTAPGGTTFSIFLPETWDREDEA